MWAWPMTNLGKAEGGSRAVRVCVSVFHTCLNCNHGRKSLCIPARTYIYALVSVSGRGILMMLAEGRH